MKCLKKLKDLVRELKEKLKRSKNISLKKLVEATKQNHKIKLY